MKKSMTNISSIFSLRAIAVILVVLFHLKPKFFLNGFVGVDIFFVISGYLITKIFDDKNFSIRKEYFSRRIKRIFPSLIVVVFFSLILGFFILSPNHFQDLLNQAKYSLIGLSNFYFYFNTDYFGIEGMFRPLLHLWTIGLEIQFYLFFPLLIFLSNFFKFNLKKIVLIIFILLIFLNYLNKLYIDQNHNLFFYLHLRFYEFLFGSIAFFYKDLLKKILPSFSIYLAYLILIMMFTNLNLFNINLFFIEILPISFATIIIIIKGDINKKLINNFLLKYIGKISYSIYLVHYPIIVFYKYIFVNNLNHWDFLLQIIIILFASAASFFFVESRFYDFKK